ncbi:Glutamate--cysteine ligase [Pseudoalteromonas sp. CIP111854]|uniref:Glutamate--cysteine ligase n=1 Tax=Pseudoalteromonas holothuriae TaxID=2963714 RepID=A0A9W4R311_9GAMM|nr:glutamate--cysteine ligase [Pseudoalteromonas sp. CIP111854]CAH9064865.1 Glutamate--cysteine ligase [Pseudoalteromonas sp. CIP111854]
MITTDLQTTLAALSVPQHKYAIKGIKRGIEREALRINKNGTIAKTPHPEETGHPLTHSSITTDFSESLLEFITPASDDPEQTLSQLRDLQKFTVSKMGDELLWPVSMPCFINDENDIALAQFGDSNVGKMKTLYRQGLKNRYGSMMQAIAGVHFNISYPESLWQSLAQLQSNTQPLQHFISDKYLGLIRNFKRELWLISYLFGSSPALCSSFLQGKESHLPFKKLGKGTLYLEYGTALRLGDLGYTNSAQSSLKVTYNSLDDYIGGLREAIRCHSDLYGQLDDYTSAAPKQLNKNILQIENEFYSPIRPKRNALSGEPPTHALERGGIEYIEIRALDVNPFVDTGISLEQINFLDVFLTYCLLKPSPMMHWDEQKVSQDNLTTVVNQGRDPQVKLQQHDEQVLLSQWAADIFAELAGVASWMDEAQQSNKYSDTIQALSSWVTQPEKTFSGRLVAQLKSQQQDCGIMALHLAENYKASYLNINYQQYSEQALNGVAEQSQQAAKSIKQSDEKDFVAFLDDYFAKA